MTAYLIQVREDRSTTFGPRRPEVVTTVETVEIKPSDMRPSDMSARVDVTKIVVIRRIIAWVDEHGGLGAWGRCDRDLDVEEFDGTIRYVLADGRIIEALPLVDQKR